MMNKFLTYTLIIVLSALLFAGCATEKKAPTQPAVSEGGLTPVLDPFMASIGDTTSTMYYVYTPPGYDQDDSATRYPVLYMLHGFGGNENYYVALFSAVDAANWLISQGMIDPMIIVFPSGHNALGGSFYTNAMHPAVGLSESHILDIVAAVDASFNTVNQPSGRGIGGHSMGGYGAMSITLNNADLFGSVSSIAAPLSFWGTMPASPAYKGIEELLPTVLSETDYQAVLDTTDNLGNEAAYKGMFYPAPDRRVTSMLFAMAAAFSPTQFDFTNPQQPIPQILPTTIDSIIVGLDEDGAPIKQAMWVDLPLGIDGQLDSLVWTRWLEKDPVTRFTLGRQFIALTGVKVYLDVGVADDLGLSGAHQVFEATLLNMSMPVDNSSYFNGYPDSEGDIIPADHTTHVFERIKKQLIWHSDQF